MNATILRVWNNKWNDTPEAEFAALGSQDDRDNVAFVPSEVTIPLWLEAGGAFGCCDVEQVPVHGGTLLIGHHA